jgi:hypothetical protein
MWIVQIHGRQEFKYMAGRSCQDWKKAYKIDSLFEMDQLLLKDKVPQYTYG